MNDVEVEVKREKETTTTPAVPTTTDTSHKSLLQLFPRREIFFARSLSLFLILSSTRVKMRFVAMATSRSAGAATTSKAAARPAGAALRKASAARISAFFLCRRASLPWEKSLLAVAMRFVQRR